jgi:hypothetical protein
MQHQLDHEKLDVYQIELQFVAWSTELMVELGESVEAKTRRIAETCDHLDRAGLSSEVREDHVRYGIEDEDEDETKGRDGSPV